MSGFAMRYRRERLTMINRPHGPGLVLARRYPGDEHLRALAIEDWGHVSYSPRQRVEPGIHIPLPPRQQTAQEASFPREVRDALNGVGPSDNHPRGALEHERPQISGRIAAEIDATPPTRRQHGTARIRTRLE